MHSFPKTDLLSLPFVDHQPIDGRRVLLLPFLNPSTQDWDLYLEHEPGMLGKVAGGEPVYSLYYAYAPVDCARDLELPIGTLITQHLSFSRVLRRLTELENDVHQCGAILEKYHIISAVRATPARMAGLLVTSELEYLLLLLRSMFDVLQQIVLAVTNLLITLDGSKRRIMKNALPGSFADMVLHGNQLKTTDEIMTKYSLPSKLAAWYVEEAPLFQRIRDLRDGIAHRGQTVGTVFALDEGLAVDPDWRPWNMFDVWPLDHRIGKLGALRALFATLIVHSIEATTRFAAVVQATVQLPTAIGTDLRLFVRSPFSARLVAAPIMVTDPWEGMGERDSGRRLAP